MSPLLGIVGYYVQGFRHGNTAQAVLGGAVGASAPLLAAFLTGAAYTFPDRVQARFGRGDRLPTPRGDPQVKLRSLDREIGRESVMPNSPSNRAIAGWNWEQRIRAVSRTLQPTGRSGTTTGR